MIAMPADRPGPATYQDIIDLPETLTGEIIDGELFVSPRPVSRHSLAVANLIFTLLGPFGRGLGGPGGWVFLIEPEVHLGADVMVPDLAGWRRERLPPEELPDYISITPDWICETLSPSTAKRDRGIKLRAYLGHGVAHAWLIDPTAKTLEVFAADRARWALVGVWGEGERVAAPPFDVAPFPITSLWSTGSP